MRMKKRIRSTIGLLLCALLLLENSGGAQAVTIEELQRQIAESLHGFERNDEVGATVADEVGCDWFG